LDRKRPKKRRTVLQTGRRCPDTKRTFVCHRRSGRKARPRGKRNSETESYKPALASQRKPRPFAIEECAKNAGKKEGKGKVHVPPEKIVVELGELSICKDTWGAKKKLRPDVASVSRRQCGMKAGGGLKHGVDCGRGGRRGATGATG